MSATGHHFHRMIGLVDHAETYGSDVLRRFVGQVGVRHAVDLGAGAGRDLDIVKAAHPTARLTAIEVFHESVAKLKLAGHEVLPLNMERDRLPFADESVDLVIANQFLEHTKEIWWIASEVSRCLRVGGHFIIGVPNVASFHNRLLLLAGIHPTQHKLYTAHVRPFSKRDTLRFFNYVFPGGYQLADFGGSQFYPFPPLIARPLARLLPTLAFSIFFLLRKEKTYAGEFLQYPVAARLQTNFYLGGHS